jgi:hypothetical protein
MPLNPRSVTPLSGTPATISIDVRADGPLGLLKSGHLSDVAQASESTKNEQ